MQIHGGRCGSNHPGTFLISDQAMQWHVAHCGGSNSSSCSCSKPASPDSPEECAKGCSCGFLFWFLFSDSLHPVIIPKPSTDVFHSSSNHPRAPDTAGKVKMPLGEMAVPPLIIPVFLSNEGWGASQAELLSGVGSVPQSSKDYLR